MAMTYDRRAPAGLMTALVDGFAASLKDYVLARQYPVDLQLRGYEGKGQHRATLYVGLTKVLDLHHRQDGRFKLAAHPSYMTAKRGWSDSWSRWHRAEQLGVKWEGVEEYLDTVIPAVGLRYLKEGRTQAAVNTLRNEALTIIDREVVIAFASASEKSEITKPLAQKLLHAVEREEAPDWWTTGPTKLGDECDALAVRDGELLAIEIKPRTASAKAIAWVPLQVRHYANLLDKWAATHPKAAEVIDGMVEQRVALGLAPNPRTPLRRPLVVRPVVVLEHGCSMEALSRLNQVRQTLAEAALDTPSLEVLVLTAAGRLKPVPLA
jgi:hypothetical protein